MFFWTAQDMSEKVLRAVQPENQRIAFFAPIR